MRYIIFITSILFFSCDSGNKKLITINKDFSIQELPFEQTSDQDFEKYIKQNNTAFTLTTQTPEDYIKQAAGFELCGNDSELYTYQKIYRNDSLGMIFKFSRYENETEYKFSEYELNRSDFFQYTTLKNNKFHKNQLKSFHITIDNNNAYVSNQKYTMIDLVFEDLNDTIKHLTHLAVIK